ncbi:hypothetical protein GCM10010372_81730 [Streptomyces tauricus]|nr:hypothetical protein GCM10010372_81730 [Streptomyces tauricus]
MRAAGGWGMFSGGLLLRGNAAAGPADPDSGRCCAGDIAAPLWGAVCECDRVFGGVRHSESCRHSASRPVRKSDYRRVA